MRKYTSREYNDRYRAKNPLKYGWSNCKLRLKITFEEYKLLFKDAPKLCPICDRALIYQGRSNNRAVIDHDHTTGVVRGIICSNCNLALGYVNDNPEYLEKLKVWLYDRRPDKNPQQVA